MESLRQRGCGKKTKFHYLRHTFAVIEWKKTGDIYLVSKKLGHSFVTTTEIYTKLELCQIREDFPSLTRKFNGGGQRDIRLQLWESLIDEIASVVQW